MIAPLSDRVVGKLDQKEQLRRKHVHKSSSIIGASDLTFALHVPPRFNDHSVTRVDRDDGRSPGALRWSRQDGQEKKEVLDVTDC